MSAALRCNESRPWRAGFARRFAAPSILCLALFAAAPNAASAGSSGIRIGIGPGVLGAMIMKDHAPQTRSTRKATTQKSTAVRKKPVTRSSSSQSKTRSQSETARLPDQPTAAPAATTAAAPAATIGAAAAPAAALAAAASKETGPSAEIISTPEEIRSAQEHLRYLGYDIPDATGALDLKTKIAIMQFQDSAGAASTGILTVEQLQLLFRKAAERQARTH